MAFDPVPHRDFGANGNRSAPLGGCKQNEGQVVPLSFQAPDHQGSGAHRRDDTPHCVSRLRRAGRLVSGSSFGRRSWRISGESRGYGQRADEDGSL